MPSNTRRVRLFLAVVTATATACASGGAAASAPGTSPGEAPSTTARRDASIITQAELLDPALKSLNVYDAIKTLRPNFLSNRGTQTISFEGNNGLVDNESGKVHASIDNSGVLPVEELKRVPVTGVVEVRLLTPAAAMQRFGATAKQGAVIAVRTM